jgi:hypothetical protein
MILLFDYDLINWYFKLICLCFQFKEVGLGYGRYLYFQCLLKYMSIRAFGNSPSIPSLLLTKIVYIGYNQIKKWLLFLLPVHSYGPCRAHQTRRSGRNYRSISSEVALPLLQREIKVALFLFLQVTLFLQIIFVLL